MCDVCVGCVCVFVGGVCLYIYLSHLSEPPGCGVLLPQHSPRGTSQSDPSLSPPNSLLHPHSAQRDREREREREREGGREKERDREREGKKEREGGREKEREVY